MIKWIDKRSVLRQGKKVYRAGDVLPADLLSKSRIDYLLEVNKIEIEKQEVVQPEKHEKETVKKSKPGRKKKHEKIESVIDETETIESGETESEVTTDESPEE